MTSQYKIYKMSEMLKDAMDKIYNDPITTKIPWWEDPSHQNWDIQHPASAKVYSIVNPNTPIISISADDLVSGYNAYKVSLNKLKKEMEVPMEDESVRNQFTADDLEQIRIMKNTLKTAYAMIAWLNPFPYFIGGSYMEYVYGASSYDTAAVFIPYDNQHDYSQLDTLMTNNNYQKYNTEFYLAGNSADRYNGPFDKGWGIFVTNFGPRHNILKNIFPIKHLQSISYQGDKLYISKYAIDCLNEKVYEFSDDVTDSQRIAYNDYYNRNGWNLKTG